MSEPPCDYGCGMKAKHQLKNGKWCCCKSHNSCIIIREKNRRSSIGRKHTKETKEKISRACTGIKYRERTKEHRRKLSIANSGKKKSKEHIEKIRESNKKSNRPLFFGKMNPMWRGGISIEPYCDQWVDKDYKESIKKRDGYICLNPECSKITKILNIHHIDYNKKNCHPLNLITLCVSCNAKANKDRSWHKSWYKAIIDNRYKRIGYKCHN